MAIVQWEAKKASDYTNAITNFTFISVIEIKFVATFISSWTH